MTKSTDKWMPFFVGDYHRDTRHLTLEQHGAYLLLLMHGWVHRTIPNDDIALAAICGTTRTHFVRNIGPAVRLFFFVRQDGSLMQKRLEVELEKSAKNLAQKSLAGHAKNAKFLAAKASNINGIISTAACAAGGADDMQTSPAAYVPSHKEREGREERVLPTEVAASPPSQPKQVQASPLEKSEPTDKTAGQMLYSEGLQILGELTGKKLHTASGKGSLVRLVSKMRKEADNRDDLLLDILRRARDQPPASAVGWIKGAITNGKARLVVDNDPMDAQGIAAWCKAAAAAGLIEPYPGDPLSDGYWLAHNVLIDGVAKRVARAARLPFAWRGDWMPLLDWIKTGIKIVDLVRIIEKRVEWIHINEGYEPTTLKRFNSVVMAGREQAA
jgi:uncharacterized protein YdaU (DUF1376 family)